MIAHGVEHVVHYSLARASVCCEMRQTQEAIEVVITGGTKVHRGREFDVERVRDFQCRRPYEGRAVLQRNVPLAIPSLAELVAMHHLGHFSFFFSGSLLAS